MSDLTRLLNEYLVVGIKVLGINGAEFIFDGEPNHNLIDLVNRAHIEDDFEPKYGEVSYLTYLTTDLENYPPTIRLREFLGSESLEWKGYLTLQTNMIRDLRKSAFAHPTTGSDGLRDQYLADELTKEDWLLVRQQIKDRFPWPGNYR